MTVSHVMPGDLWRAIRSPAVSIACGNTTQHLPSIHIFQTTQEKYNEKSYSLHRFFFIGHQYSRFIETQNMDILMASSKEYFDFVMDQLSDLKELSNRKMMGEYVIYYQKKVVGGIYDNRLLLKPTPSALQRLNDTGVEWKRAIPYDGAKEMLTADIDDHDLTCQIIQAIAKDLSEPKPKTKK